MTAPASNLPPHLNFGRPVELIPLDQLRPWARNARTHSKKQIGQIAQSIRRFGFTNPVLIDGENRILAGHGRVEAARTLGMAAAPCLRFDHLPIQEKRAYILADNKLALNAGWDEELLALDLFGGSGSTNIAAHKTGRRARVCELDPIYCDRILRRWEVFAKDDAELIGCGLARAGERGDGG